MSTNPSSENISALTLISRIDSIIKITPDDFKDKDNFISALSSVKKSIYYSDPKLINTKWSAVERILNNYLGNIEDNWCKEVEKIFEADF